MTAELASNLHNGDQVIDKKTNAVCSVLTVEKMGKHVVLEVLTPFNTYKKLTHAEVR